MTSATPGQVPAVAMAGPRPDLLEGYLAECRGLVLDEIRRIVPADSSTSGRLYELMLDYPLRDAKALRPALAIATCRALGGRLSSVLRSAAVLELYHNAFLIHDDVEDESLLRRRSATLHRTHGVPIAVNVGDGMLALALTPLLDNMDLLGMGKALRILQEVGAMARASAEGQAMELDWIRSGCPSFEDRRYLHMIYKKSAWYTFVTPMAVGSIAAGAPGSLSRRLRWFAVQLGLAFQIQDDVLNLVGEQQAYGKEIDGDLWEGKHTLILMHAMRRASSTDRRRASSILAKRRPLGEAPASFARLLAQLEAEGHLDATARQRLLQGQEAQGAAFRTQEDVAFLRRLIEDAKSIGYCRQAARRRARHARGLLATALAGRAASVHSEFLESLVGFVVERDR
ncbi:MAG: polyprenyl synthetase family protein [Candidatus Binatia bacterium]